MSFVFTTLIVFIFSKVNYCFILLDGILHRLPSAALLSLNTTENEVGSIYHFTVADLDGSFWMSHRCGIGDFHIAVIVVIVFLVIQILGSRIRQHKNEGAVVIPILLSDSKHGGGCKLIELAVTPYEEVYVFVFRKQSADFFFQPILLS